MFSGQEFNKLGLIACTDTSVRHYHYTLRNNLVERRSHLLRGGSLKSRVSLLVHKRLYVRFTHVVTLLRLYFL